MGKAGRRLREGQSSTGQLHSLDALGCDHLVGIDSAPFDMHT